MKILDGNAFKLRITYEQNVEDYKATTDMSQVESLLVNFVRRGRITQTSGVDSVGRIVASNSGNLAIGIYGVELTGYYNGAPWRFYADDVFEIINDENEVSESVIDEGVPIYDVTFTLSLGGSADISFVDSAIINHNNNESAHGDIRRELGDKIDDILVDDESVVVTDPVTGKKEVKFDSDNFGKVDDVKVNGTSVVSQKVANIPVPTKTSDLQNDSNFPSRSEIPTKTSELQNDSNFVTDEEMQTAMEEKQDAIAGVNLEYEEDGGQPSGSAEFENGALTIGLKNLKMKFADLTAAEKEELRGPEGIPGESVIVGQGDLPLTHVAGTDPTKAISQKGFTDELENAITYKIENIDLSQYTGNYADRGYYVYSNKWNSAGRSRTIPIQPGHHYIVIPSAAQVCAIFKEYNGEKTTSVADKYSTAEGFTAQLSLPVTGREFTAPADGYFLYVRTKISSESTTTTFIVKEKVYLDEEVDNVRNDMNGVTDNILAICEDMEGGISDIKEELRDPQVFEDIDVSNVTNADKIINANGNWAVESGRKHAFYRVTPGQKYMIKANPGTIWAMLRSNTVGSAGTRADFSTIEGYTSRLGASTDVWKEFTVPSDANYLYVQTVTSQGNVTWYLKKSTSIGNRLRALEQEDEISANEAYDGEEVHKRRILAEVIGNPLTPLTANVDANGYEIPATKQEQAVWKKSRQMTDIIWTPLAAVPCRTSGGEMQPFPANTPVTGLPYSSAKEIDKMICYDVSIHTFMTAVNNPYSLLYTENISEEDSQSAWGKTYHGVNCATYFGTVCSELSGYVSGQRIQWQTAHNAWQAAHKFNIVKIYDQSAQGLRIGDIYWKNGHNRVIVRLKRNAQTGAVTDVIIAESIHPCCKQMDRKTAAEINNLLASENAIIYRNTELYKNVYTPSPFVAVDDEVITPYNYNDDICTFAGDKASFRVGELVVLNYNLKSVGNWTAIKVYKDNVLLDTYPLADIVQSELSEGQRGHALNLGTELPYGSYKACMTDGTNDSDYTYWEVIETTVTHTVGNVWSRVAWTSHNGKPIAYALCSSNGGKYLGDELSTDAIRLGYLDIDWHKMWEQFLGTSIDGKTVYLKVYFEGQYGRVTNEPITLQF